MDIAICHRQKVGQVWESPAPLPEIAGKVDRNSLSLALQCRVNSISLQCITWPVACFEWGVCLTDFQFQILGQMTPWSENFRKCLSGFRDGTPKYVLWPNLVKISRCEVAERSRGLPNKKTCTLRDSSQPPFCPKWADHTQNSLNVVTPWHVHVYWIWSRLGAFCRAYSGKIDFLAPKVNTI